jgi:hypothetical protein
MTIGEVLRKVERKIERRAAGHRLPGDEMRATWRRCHLHFPFHPASSLDVAAVVATAQHVDAGHYTRQLSTYNVWLMRVLTAILSRISSFCRARNGRRNSPFVLQHLCEVHRFDDRKT